MSYEADIHTAQIEILRVLLFNSRAKFTELQKGTGLSSDHFNFHIKKLISTGLVNKHDNHYSLTTRGKEYANRLDTDENTIEKQPKTAVMLLVTRNGEGDRDEFVFQERLKNPFFGYWGLPTGKVRWGETMQSAAIRELEEETGLHAEIIEMIGIYHEFNYQKESGELLEDKIFYLMQCTDLSGDLLSEFEGGHNAWLTTTGLQEKDKLFPASGIEMEILGGKHPFYIEREVFTSKSEF